MHVPKLYGELAHLWPVVSPHTAYAAEAQLILRLLERWVASDAARPRVLEMGAGAGLGLAYLNDRYACTAVDISEPMLAICEQQCPDLPRHVGDMRSVRLHETFDAVLAHDAIDYMKTPSDLRAACDTAAAHLQPGGIFIAAPCYLAESFADHEVQADSFTSGPTEVAQVLHVQRRQHDQDTYGLTMLFLIRCDGRLQIVEDRHTCGLFSRQTWVTIMEQAGFGVHEELADEVDAGGSELPFHVFVGVRR